MMTNPFDDQATTHRRQAMSSSRTKSKQHKEDPIFEARHIEWPLPSTLPSFPEETTAKNNSDKPKTNTNTNASVNYLGGLVGKFIGQTPTEKDTLESQFHGKNKTLKAPRLHCTAAANGWIVSLVESGSTSSASRWSRSARSLATMRDP